MIPREFNYVKPTSLEGAIAVLVQHGEQAKLMSGGHSLIPMMKLRLASPEVIVDINELSALHGVLIEPHYVRIGAATTHAEIEHHRGLKVAIPMLPAVASVIADATVRNRGTIGGSLAHADPSADWPAAMLALDARLEIAGPGGTRIVPATEFFKGLFETSIQVGEILTNVQIPIDGHAHAAYKKFRHPASGYAVVAAAVVMQMARGVCRTGRIAITGYADAPFRAYEAEKLLPGFSGQPERLAEIAAVVFANAMPLQDRFADEEYRLQLGRTMVRRALTEATAV